MELAIPLLALGSMYIISNNNNEQERESFQNINSRPLSSSTYPVATNTTTPENTQHYPSPNKATSDYLNQNAFDIAVQNGQTHLGKNMPTEYRVEGDYMKTTSVVDANKIPFVGGKIRGQLYGNGVTSSILDTYSGAGSQVNHKSGQAPLFKSQKNMSWAHGTPNTSDFMQSRVNVSQYNSCVQPFETKRVGPGLNQDPNNTAGSGGFNSGLEARDILMPKQIDDMRTLTNPKTSFSYQGLEGPAQSTIHNRGQQGRVEKNRPDTYYESNQNRWLTTTGAEIAPPLQPTAINEKKKITNSSMAPANNGPVHKNAGYAPTTYLPSKRNEQTNTVIPSQNATRTTPFDHTHSLKTNHKLYMNNRSDIQPNTSFGAKVSTAIGALLAPILPSTRVPPKKDDHALNDRIYGNAHQGVAQAYIAPSPDYAAPTTVKETTLHETWGNVQGGSSAHYVTTDIQPSQTNRSTVTSQAQSYMAPASSNYGTGTVQHKPNAPSSAKESTLNSRINHGNTSSFNNQINVSNIKSDELLQNNRSSAPTLPQRNPGTTTFGFVSNVPVQESNKTSADRLDPVMIEAFKKNPYTHSFESVA